MKLKRKSKAKKDEIKINRNVEYFSKIGITAVIILALLVFMALRNPLKFDNEECPECENIEQCEDTCSFKCIKKFLDHVSYTGYINESVVCNCICDSSVRLFLENLRR